MTNWLADNRAGLADSSGGNCEKSNEQTRRSNNFEQHKMRTVKVATNTKTIRNTTTTTKLYAYATQRTRKWKQCQNAQTLYTETALILR